MNRITDKMKIGTVGELLVQLRLLEHDIQAAPPLKGLKKYKSQENHMPQLIKSHKNCKFFSYKACPHKNEEIMKRSTLDIPQHYGGNYQTFPRDEDQDEQIDAICSKCDKFTLK